MCEDELTTDDFTENDLPQRPAEYCPEYRTDVRRFALICCVIAVGLAVVYVSQPF